MISKQTVIIILIWLSLIFGGSSWALKAGQPGRLLFTEQEAENLDLSELQAKEWSDYVNRHFARTFGTRGISTKGPRIEVMYPSVKTTEIGQTIETRSPTRLIVEFVENATGNSVDMSTLEVIGKKGWFTKTLTDELRPFIEGTQIEAVDLEIPAGKFHLEVSIANTAGVRTVENYILVVR